MPAVQQCSAEKEATDTQTMCRSTLTLLKLKSMSIYMKHEMTTSVAKLMSLYPTVFNVPSTKS
jgi:hypothetical protein